MKEINQAVIHVPKNFSEKHGTPNVYLRLLKHDIAYLCLTAVEGYSEELKYDKVLHSYISNSLPGGEYILSNTNNTWYVI